MRILMLSKACVVGTYQRKLEEMARLPGVELTVIVPPVWADPSGDVPLERAHVQGYRMLVEPIRLNGNFHLHYFPTFKRCLREIRPDIVHIDEEPYNFAAWHAFWFARRAGAKTLFFSWQNILRRYPPPFSLGEAWILRGVDYALMGTESAATIWRAKGYRGPLAVIPQFGVDPEQFKPAVRAKEVEAGTFVIGYVGRLVPEKGVDLLIRAFAELRGRKTQAKAVIGHELVLKIVGQGPERGALEALATALEVADCVTFVGHKPSTQMPDIYREMDVIVVPSRTRPNWKEQFGRTLIEAMACGVPVIGSDSGAIPDVIGDAGLVFPEENLRVLVERLAALRENATQRAEYAQRGRARVLALYTHAQVATQTVEVYREMSG